MQPTRPVAFVRHRGRAVSASRPLGFWPEREKPARFRWRNRTQGRVGIRRVRYPAPENPRRRQAGLASDKEGPCRPIKRRRQRVDRGVGVGRVEPKHNGQTQVSVIVPPALMGPRIGRRSTGTSGWDATGSPCPIPDDNRSYPLPPGLGDFPLYRVDDHAARLPPAWREHGGVFLPIAQSEAMWLSFSGSYPMALRIASGKIDAPLQANPGRMA